MAEPLQVDLDEKVREFVSNATGLDFDLNVIPGNDSHGSPNTPYASVLELTKAGIGIDSEVVIEGDTATTAKLKHKGVRKITYSVQFYKEGAADFAESLLSYASTDLGQIWLAQNDLTWVIAGTVLNLDTVMGTKFEERRAVDITFRYQSRMETDINRIGSVEIDFTLSAEADLTEHLEVTDA